MNFKKIVLSGILATASIWGAGAVNASCLAYGPVEQVYTTGAWTYAYVNLASTTGLPAYYYYFATNDPNEASALQNSLHKNVYLWGDATACPTTGAMRYGGNLTAVYVN